MSQIKERSLFVRIFTNNLFLYCLKRIFSAMITLVLIILVVFSLFRALPKEKFINKSEFHSLTEEQEKVEIERQLEALGLTGNYFSQVGNFFYNMLPFPKEICMTYGKESLDSDELVCKESEIRYIHFGTSVYLKPVVPVTDHLPSRMQVSFIMSVGSTFLAYLIAFPLGVFMAKHKGKLTDKLGNGYIIALLAVPNIVIYFAIYLATMKMGVPAQFQTGNMWSWLVPMVSGAFLGAGGVTMWVRRYMVDEMSSDYVKFARSKGLSENRILFTHVFRNIIVFMARSFPATFILAITGSYFAESLWQIPGMGTLLVEGMQKLDLPLVMALVTIYAGLSMFALIMGDIATVIADPRISLTKNK